MPYIITTSEPTSRGIPSGEQMFLTVSRRAFGSLKAARVAVTTAALIPALGSDDYASLRQQFSAIGEAGGTLGPLPDGTMIEVEQASWDDPAIADFDLDPRALRKGAVVV